MIVYQISLNFRWVYSKNYSVLQIISTNVISTLLAYFLNSYSLENETYYQLYLIPNYVRNVINTFPFFFFQILLSVFRSFVDHWAYA